MRVVLKNLCSASASSSTPASEPDSLPVTLTPDARELRLEPRASA